jgi:hypothetical protein
MLHVKHRQKKFSRMSATRRSNNRSRCCVVPPRVTGVEVIAELEQLSCGGARPKLAGWARRKSITKRVSQKTSTTHRGKLSAEDSARQILGLKQSWYDCFKRCWTSAGRRVWNVVVRKSASILVVSEELASNHVNSLYIWIITSAAFNCKSSHWKS